MHPIKKEWDIREAPWGSINIVVQHWLNEHNLCVRYAPIYKFWPVQKGGGGLLIDWLIDWKIIVCIVLFCMFCIFFLSFYSDISQLPKYHWYIVRNISNIKHNCIAIMLCHIMPQRQWGQDRKQTHTHTQNVTMIMIRPLLSTSNTEA